MRNKNIKTKTRFIRASKTARQCISSVQGNEEIRFIDLGVIRKWRRRGITRNQQEKTTVCKQSFRRYRKSGSKYCYRISSIWTTKSCKRT